MEIPLGGKARNLYAVIVAVVVIAGLWAYGINGLAIVDGRSMEPLFHTGDVVVLAKRSPDEIKVDDVVVYKNQLGKYIIHRVIKVYKVGDQYCYIIKGDNNALPDTGFPQCPPPSNMGVRGVPYEAIKGVVVSVNGVPLKVPYLGGITLILRG